LVGEARRLGLVGVEEAANLTDIPNIRQKGTRLGNWLTRVILALLVGCALRRTELAELEVSTIQMRENRWVLADLEGKGRRIRTVAIPLWVKGGIDAWMSASGIEEGRLLRSIRKGGKLGGSLSDWAVWSVVEQSARQIGIEHFGAHDLRRTCAKLCRKSGGDLEQINSCWDTARSRPQSVTLGLNRRSPSPLTTAWGCETQRLDTIRSGYGERSGQAEGQPAGN